MDEAAGAKADAPVKRHADRMARQDFMVKILSRFRFQELLGRDCFFMDSNVKAQRCNFVSTKSKRYGDVSEAVDRTQQLKTHFE